ncbi:MAG: response regulator transcription factor [Thermoflexibacter sp.]|nr:response regulator transcription factor [Thermoflexibacter sp.]
MIQLMLVDDHQIIRDGIKQLLTNESDIKVVAEASNVKEALKHLDTIRPNIVMTDLSMPNGSGFDFIKSVTATHTDIKVVVLSMHVEEAYIRKAIELGVSGYMPKDISKFELVEAIQTVARGEMYFSSTVSKVMMNNMVKKVRKNEQAAQATAKLTQREKEIVKLILDGMSSPEIAEKLFISHRTVENHRANIMNKLKVRNTIELVKKVLENEFWDQD